ncbi:surfeit locus protein 1 isoform X1 [Dermacentor silvarum]|uniref:surfeit locus protein 1 isoform X1 n=1 Tax=Dermacentor silvarum TaxID=543639 RepID=UPI00189B53FC|nr:surfeit locus protein 1 isoform X1 [Dermacentor silvarum]
MQVKTCFERALRPFLRLRWQPKTGQQCHQYTGNFKLPRDIGVAGYSLLAIPIATFALGTWQVQRRQWKLQLIDDLAKKTTIPAVDLPEDLRELNDMEYRQVRVTGTFDHEREMYVGPRSRIEPEEDSEEGRRKRRGGIITAPGQTGNLVITPFKLKDRDFTILVNRGWVPKSSTLPHKRLQGQIEGEVNLVGIVRKSEKRPPLGPKNPTTGHTWHYKDVEQMAQACGAAPVLLDAVFESTVEGGPIGGQTNVTLRNEHVSYIITWYSLSAATTFLWYHKYIRGRPLM